MKRFISCILVVTMIISMFGSLTAVGSDEPVITAYQAADALIGTAGTIVNSKLSVALDSTNGLKYYVAGTDAVMAIAYNLGTIQAGDIVDVAMNFNITDFGAMQQSLYIIPIDMYTELSAKSIKDYYSDFESVYEDYRAAVSESLDSSSVTAKIWSTDSITNVTAETDGQLIACVTGIRNGGKLTSFVKKFDVSVTSNSEGPVETNSPQATESPTIGPTQEPNVTETPTIEPTQEPHEAEMPSANPTKEPAEETTPKPEEGVTWAGSIEEFTEALKINNTTIKLYKDIDLGTSGLKTSRATYIDLNSHTLISNTSAVIEMSHDLTIVDTGATKGALKNTNSSTSYGIKCAAKNVILNIEGAEIDAESQAIMLNGADSVVNLKNNAVINGGAYAINAGANGTLNIESAVINSDENYKGYALNASGADVNIEDGNFNYNGTMSSIVISGKSNVTINGGTFKNANNKRGVINNAKGYSGTLTINGGTFENTDAAGYSILDGDEATTATPPTITITGGNFKSAIGFTKPNNTTTEITITGGTFSFDPAAYIKDTEKYEKINNGDGTYTVRGIGVEPEPTLTATPTATSTAEPTEPTVTPAVEPTSIPTTEPTSTPDVGPTATPTTKPTATPVVEPTVTPTALPTFKPTTSPAPGTEIIVTSAEEFAAALQLDNTVIKLGADIDLGTSGFKTSRITYIDLNGHMLISNTSAVIEMSHNLTIVDTGTAKGALKNTNSGTSYGIKCAAKNVILNIEGAEIDAASQAIMLNGADSVVNLKNNAVINGGAYAINAGANGTLNIESAVINSDESYKGYALNASGADVIIEDGNFNYNGTMSSIVISGKSNVTINGGTFKNMNNKRGVINNAKGYSGTLTINGGTFENTNAGGYSILDGDEATTATPPTIIITSGNFKSAIGFTKPNNTTTEITITGGTFSFDPAVYIKDTEKYEKFDNGDGTYTVRVIGVESTAAPTAEPTVTPVVEPTVTPTGLPTFKPTASPAPGTEIIVTSAEEFAAALQLDNTVIKLGADIDLGTSGFKTSYVTYIDLNGHILISNTSAVIEMSHDLTIVDTGTTKGALKNTNSSTSYGIKCTAKNVTLNVEGAEIDAASQAIMLNGAGSVVNLRDNAVINGGAYAINAGANGTLNIESASINIDESYRGYVLSTSGSTVIIENGTFNYNRTMSSIVISGKSNVTINGGTFTNPNSKRGVINNAKGYSGTLTINGGIFENTNADGYSILDGDEATTAAPPTIIITGGIFKSAIGFTKPDNTTTEIKITGGNFIFDPKKYIDAALYAIVNKNGMYTVIDKSEITETPEPTAAPKPTETPIQTDTPKPTETPTQTDTPKPTETPAQTDTPKPTKTPVQTDTPKPTETPAQTDTPKPTETPVQTDTPKPTETPAQTDTPNPIDTPNPSATAAPTQTPSETDSPQATPIVKPTSKPSIWGPDEPVRNKVSSGGGGGGGISSEPLPPLVPTATSKPEITVADLKENTEKSTKAEQQPVVVSNDAWFTDVSENQWYYDYVKYVVDNGLMSGMSDTEFGSEINIQRCMFVTVLYRMDGEPDSADNVIFADVPENSYFEKAVAWASENGIVSGYSDKEFAPDKNITREQLAAIIWRYAQYKGIDVSFENDNTLSYDDTQEISNYAIPAMRWIIGAGIIGGFDDNTLRPKDNTTRAQTAKILKKFSDTYNVIE